jgi:FkbM family methyltransferase
MKNEQSLSDILEVLPTIASFHCRENSLYRFINSIALESVQLIFGEGGPQRAEVRGIGNIKLPYIKFGAIDTTHLFGLDELIIFAYYLANRHRYKRVADVGSNVGLHAIVLAHLGFDVIAYEPDPVHFSLLKDNLVENKVGDKVLAKNMAVSTKFDTVEFVRVLGNTTGSHLAGAKNAPYGDLERFSVNCEAFSEVTKHADLIKIDVEGHELQILRTTTEQDWEATDAFVEVGSIENAKGIFEHMSSIGVTMYVQKRCWEPAQCHSDLPASYKEGSLFLSRRSHMSWT